jgi:hypothetical protein
MKIKMLKILMILIFIFLSVKSNAQYSPEIMKQDSILKAKFENYERKTIRNINYEYLQKNGFYIIDYSWDDEKINLHLGRIYKYKKASKDFVSLSATSLGLGYVFHMASVMGNESLKGNTIYKRFYAASAGFLVLKLALNGAALKNLNAAKKIRNRNLNLF